MPRPRTRQPEARPLHEVSAGSGFVGVAGDIRFAWRQWRQSPLRRRCHPRAVEGGCDAIRGAAPPAAGGGRRYGAGRLTPEEVAVIDLYFSRRDQLDGHARVRAARQIAARIQDRLAITDRIDDDEQLLADVAAEYREMSRFR